MFLIVLTTAYPLIMMLISIYTILFKTNYHNYYEKAIGEYNEIQDNSKYIVKYA